MFAGRLVNTNHLAVSSAQVPACLIQGEGGESLLPVNHTTRRLQVFFQKRNIASQETRLASAPCGKGGGDLSATRDRTKFGSSGNRLGCTTTIEALVTSTTGTLGAGGVDGEGQRARRRTPSRSRMTKLQGRSRARSQTSRM